MGSLFCRYKQAVPIDRIIQDLRTSLELVMDTTNSRDILKSQIIRAIGVTYIDKPDDLKYFRIVLVSVLYVVATRNENKNIGFLFIICSMTSVK